MDDSTKAILENERIPESVRQLFAERLLSADDRRQAHELETRRLALDRSRQLLSTPLVAALAGLVTLAATHVFETLSRGQESEDRITLAQLQHELEESRARLSQDIESESARTLAELEARARQREFQYEIVRAELADDGKDNADRAATLLFLARAGLLTELDQDALREMAEEQQQNPDLTIVPRLTAAEPDAGPRVVERLIFTATDDIPRGEAHARDALNRAWSDIGYHFLVRRDGAIEEGRPLSRTPAIASGANTGTIAVGIACIQREFYASDNALCAPNTEMERAAARLIAGLLNEHGLGLDAVLNREQDLEGRPRRDFLGPMAGRIKALVAEDFE
jgi:hypothetical protein